MAPIFPRPAAPSLLLVKRLRSAAGVAALVGATLAVAGCRTTGSAVAAPEAAGGTALVAQGTPDAPARPEKRPPAPTASVADEKVERMGWWLRLAGPTPEAQEGPVVLEAAGYGVSQREFELGLRTFLGTRARTPELEEAFRASLRQELLLLRWAEETRLADDPAFSAQARRAIRTAVVRLALEREARAQEIGDAEVQALYQQTKARFTTPERVQVRLIQVPTAEDATRLRARLAAGESFRQLAAAESRHISRGRFGEVDPFPRGTLSPVLEDEAFRLRPGEIGTATTPAGVFLIEKVAVLPATTRPLEEVAEQLRGEIRDARVAETIARLVREGALDPPTP